MFVVRPPRVFAAAACVACCLAAAAASGQTALTLSDALTRAAAQNKTLAAARARTAVDAANVQAAKERPNPDFTYEASKETPHQSFAGSLPLELGGKRDRRIDVAQSGADVSGAVAAQTAIDIAAAVRRAYYTLAAAERRAALTAELRDLVQRAKDAADARVAAGDAARLDALQAGLELSTAENDVIAARADAASARIALNTLLGQPATTDVSAADDVLQTAPVAPRDSAVAASLANSVDLAVLDREIALQTARRNLAQALTVPDASVGGALTYDAPGEFRVGWRVTTTVTLPLFTRHRAAVSVEEASLTALRAEREALAADVSGRAADAAVRAQAAADQLQRFTTDMLPRSADVERMAEDSYRSGQTGIAALLQAVQSARALRVRAIQAALDAQLAIADLERAIGASIK